MKAGRRDQSGELLNQFQRIQNDVRGSVSPEIENIIRLPCEVAGLAFGTDIVIELGR